MPSLEGLKLRVAPHFSKWEQVLHEAGEDRHLSGKWFLLLPSFCAQYGLYRIFEKPSHIQDGLKDKRVLEHRLEDLL